MNIIIVGNAHSAPRRIDLGGRRIRLYLLLGASACALAFIAIGAGATALLGGSGWKGEHELAEMRATLQQQREHITSMDGDSQRNLDALAVQLGRLQAQATRLNALGERLAEVGKLDDGEFDFSNAPAVGGPEDPNAIVVTALPLHDGIENLRAEFDRQEAQLQVLENLLRDRKIDSALTPSGMPVAGYVSSGFGARTDPLEGHSARHLGIDFSAPLGSPITAAADGVVTWSGQRSGYGNVVEVDHGNGYMTRYAHNSENVAQAGQRVQAGQVIAKVGSTGRSTGPHCHFEVWLNDRPVNPMAYVKSQRAPRA